MIPRILKNFNAFVNGQGYSGRIEEATLPEIKLKTESHRAGGMDAEYEVDMGMDAMTCKLTTSEPMPDLITALSNGTRIQLRGSFVRDRDNSRVAVICEIAGRGKSFTGGSWKAGDKGSYETEFAVDYFRWNQAGVDLIEIDVENMIRNVGGIDQLAGIRADLAM